jgi:hypothetical protein
VGTSDIIGVLAGFEEFDGLVVSDGRWLIYLTNRSIEAVVLISLRGNVL